MYYSKTFSYSFLSLFYHRLGDIYSLMLKHLQCEQECAVFGD